MTDDNLINYYHGINDRLKDINNEISLEESPDQTEQEGMVSNMPLIIGGEGYTLNQKRKIVLKEIHLRNLTP